MTELHVALLATAAVVVLALFGWGKWQERQQIRRLREQFGTTDHDPLFQPQAQGGLSQRIEPRLGQLPGEAALSDAAAPAPPSTNEPHPRPQLADWAEDPLVDCVLEVRCAHAVDGVAVIDAAAPLARLRNGLAVHLVAWDARIEQWVLPDRFGFYSELLAAIQLASRGHTLGELEASEFIAAVQQLALALDADFDPPDVPRTKQRAADLAKLIAQFDVQIGLTFDGGETVWNPMQVNTVAQQVGLVAAGERRWQRTNEAGEPLFALALSAAMPQRLSLELDVPLVPAAGQPLRAMFTVATELVALLNARVVDDHGRPIQPGSVDAIALQLDALYTEMRAAGIEPGSARARRLYR